jgi:hypothetical protein
MEPRFKARRARTGDGPIDRTAPPPTATRAVAEEPSTDGQVEEGDDDGEGSAAHEHARARGMARGMGGAAGSSHPPTAKRARTVELAGGVLHAGEAAEGSGPQQHERGRAMPKDGEAGSSQSTQAAPYALDRN